MLPHYVTHTFGVDDVQAAFELACRPTPERIKIAIVAMTRRAGCRQALAAKEQVWGGWVVGPTIIGPEEFAKAGYDYVGFDVQHGYLDDADVALLLRRLEHVPIATAVRLPSADPAPIGRVLDAGADAVIIAMVESAEQAAAAVAATRYAPAGVRSFGPLRASLGLDPAAHRGAGERVRDDRNAQRDCRRSTRSAPSPGCPASTSARRIWRSRWAYDLAEAWTHPTVLRRDRSASRPPRRRPGLVAGIHAGDGQARKGHGRAGLSDDHAGVGIPGAAARRGRTLAEATSQEAAVPPDRRGYQEHATASRW